MFTLKQLLTMLCSDEVGQTWSKRELLTAIFFVVVLTITTIIL